MPIVTVNLLEGRSPEQIEGMIAAVSEALVRSLDAPIETVRVMVNELQPHGFGIAGRPAYQVMAERRAAAGQSEPEEEESP
ncbi:MAG: 2-hydroxymuconate tautomerase [Acidimicrobiia bacterium]|nr:2-hydroxymuconate tautomerase [Acidimicrobiia bacterium]MYH55377.1 2-hydroxymuconate tautomerase [Acidimicrobiia bacterium]